MRFLRRHGALPLASVIGLVACAGCGVVHMSTTLGPARKLAIATDGQPSALYAPIYEALADGGFARGALSVSVIATASGTQALAALGAHQAEVAIASEPQLLAARAQGARLVAIGALVPVPLEAIISLASHPIDAATQLIGKTVASNGSALAGATLRSFLATAAVPASRVHTIAAGASLDASLVAHKAVAAVGGLWDYDAVALRLAHHTPHVIRLPVGSMPTFSDLAIVVRAGEAHRDGALLRAFLQSLTRGEKAVRADPGAAASVLAKANPKLSRRFELAALDATEPATAPPRGEPFGFQDPTAWASFGSWMGANGLLSHPTHGGLAITDEFLPGQGE